jgi:RNA polymerase sigma-70 factor (ECF subfamily)
MDTPSSFRTSFSLLDRLRRQPDDQDAWGAFVDRYGPLVYSWCRQWQLQDADARDVTQEVLLRLARTMRAFTYDPAGTFRGWLRTLARHAWSDFVAARQRPGEGSGGDVDRLLDNVAAPDELVQHLESAFDLEVLEEARLRVQWRVDSSSWDAFRLTALEGVAGAEVATRLGLSVAAVYKAKSRVLKMLQDEVRQMEEAPTP